MQHLINQNIRAIPINSLRCLFELAKPNALNLASSHPALAHTDTQNLILATYKTNQNALSWRYGSSAGDAGSLLPSAIWKLS